MSEAFAAKDDEKLKDYGEVLVNLVRVQPFFLRPQLKSIITSIVQVVACKDLEDGVLWSISLWPFDLIAQTRSIFSGVRHTSRFVRVSSDSYGKGQRNGAQSEGLHSSTDLPPL